MELSLPGVDRTHVFGWAPGKREYEKQPLFHIYKQNTNFPILHFTIMLEGDIKKKKIKLVELQANSKKGSIFMKACRNFFKYLREQVSLKQKKWYLCIEFA